MTLQDYASDLTAPYGVNIRAGEVFAKILTTNDDSGRHGVHIPNEAHSFFPELPIPDPNQNATAYFDAFDTIAKKKKTLSWKYYQRYPERRVTCVNGLANERSRGRRLVIYLRVLTGSGARLYFEDVILERDGPRFAQLVEMLFGQSGDPELGTYVQAPIDFEKFEIDEALTDLLGKFDQVSELGWVDSMRAGDTGLGYTFETLVGIEENNDQTADYRGIEIKCKLAKEVGGSSTKINLFQYGPKWSQAIDMAQRIRVLGQQREDGLFACHSQVKARDANNLGLRLDVLAAREIVDLCKHEDVLGIWEFRGIERRLLEKHGRAVFIKGSSRSAGGAVQYKYSELIYCERPSIERFMDLVEARNIVFEFAMHESAPGKVRNHGYPWRLVRQEFLEQLFAFQVKLR